MKDYTLTKKEKNDFIKKYRIKNDRIIIYLATGKRYHIPYTKESEQKVLEKMRNQVIKNDKIEKQVLFDYRLGIVLTIFFATITMTCIFPILPHFIGVLATRPLLVKFLVFINLMLTIGSIITTSDTKEILDDYRKNKLYLENEEKINNQVKDNKKVLSNVSVETKNMVDNNQENKKVFDINKMDKVSLKDLKQILENIKHNKEFDFDYKPKNRIKK